MALILLLAGVLVTRFVRSGIPLPPAPFYTPPDTLPEGPPGTLIRSEPFTEGVPDGAVAWRVLYLSTGVDGEPVAVSGIIAAPAAPAAEPRPVIAWAHGTLGVLPACATSHLPDPFTAIPEVERLLREGYVLAATDYPGLGTPGVHPYLFGDVEAAAVLDSVRAAQQLDAGAGDRFVVWGHSQGGHAALWTAMRAAGYAPELELLGAAAIAPAADLTGIVQASVSHRAGAILLPLAAYAWQENTPDIRLQDVVRPDALDDVLALAQTCITTPAALLLQGPLAAPEDWLLTDPTTLPAFQRVIAANTPDGPIDVPLLIAHGTDDVVIPFEGSVKEADRRCAAGEQLALERYPGDGHNAVVDSSAVRVLGWIGDRFAGRPPGSNCGDE